MKKLGSHQQPNANGFNNNNQIFEGDKGRVLLELSKTYKGDDRFKLNEKFKEDLEVEKLPEKFKQIAEKEIIDKALEKTKKIQKKVQPKLMISRYEPGTTEGSQIIKKAEGRQRYIESIKKGEEKKKKKIEIQKGIDKVKKAEYILNKRMDKKISLKKPEFKIEIKGDRQQAFQKSEFKLFQ